MFPRAGLGFVENTTTFVTIGDIAAFCRSERSLELGQHISTLFEKCTTLRSKAALFLLENVISDIRKILKLHFKEFFGKNRIQTDLN
jgi:hypothetical protein